MKIDVPYYFSHDSNARNDLKIKALRRKYKSAGYGNWWIVLEYLKEAKDYKLKLDGLTSTALCEEFDVNIEALQTFIDDLINVFQLLKSDGEWFWSDGLIKRMSIRDEKRKKLQEAGRKGAERKAGLSHPEATLKPPLSHPEALKEKKRKEKKGNTLPDLGIEELSFEEFWVLYDKKVGKKAAFSLWRNVNEDERRKLMNHIPFYKEAQPDKSFRKDPETYLRNQAWHDELIQRNVVPMIAVNQPKRVSEYI